MIVLSPEGKAQTSAAKVAAVPRFQDLHGKVIGLLDNSKPNADKLAERFAELLKKEYGVAKVISRRKLTAQQGAPKQYLDELAAQTDFVLSGLGD
jgi:DNA-binding ferritin-like protein